MPRQTLTEVAASDPEVAAFLRHAAETRLPAFDPASDVGLPTARNISPEAQAAITACVLGPSNNKD